MSNINLVPATIKDKIKAAKHTADHFGIALVVLILVAVISGLVYGANDMVFVPSLQAAKEQLVKINGELKSYDEIESQALVINDRVKIASQIEEKKARWAQIIQALLNCVPQKVQFESLTANAGKSPNFLVMANTDSEQNIILFKDKLENSDFFKNVAFKSSVATTDEASQIKRIKFSLEFDLEQLGARVQGEKK